MNFNQAKALLRTIGRMYPDLVQEVPRVTPTERAIIQIVRQHGYTDSSIVTAELQMKSQNNATLVLSRLYKCGALARVPTTGVTRGKFWYILRYPNVTVEDVLEHILLSDDEDIPDYENSRSVQLHPQMTYEELLDLLESDDLDYSFYEDESDIDYQVSNNTSGITKGQGASSSVISQLLSRSWS